MAFMVWDPSLDTGIDVIDEQHKRIVDFINELHESASTNNPEQVSHVLAELINYTVSHFAFEEELLEQHKYPLFIMHKKVHETFIQRINKHKQDHENGKNIARALSGELQIWLSNHIKNEDADYVSSLNIKPPSGGLLKKMLRKFF
jgi:hemerythrin